MCVLLKRIPRKELSCLINYLISWTWYSCFVDFPFLWSYVVNEILLVFFGLVKMCSIYSNKKLLIMKNWKIENTFILFHLFNHCSVCFETKKSSKVFIYPFKCFVFSVSSQTVSMLIIKLRYVFIFYKFKLRIENFIKN